MEKDQNNKTIYLLLGLKGSGKSYIGALIEEEYGVRFIRVEDWVLKIKREGAILQRKK